MRTRLLILAVMFVLFASFVLADVPQSTLQYSVNNDVTDSGSADLDLSYSGAYSTDTKMLGSHAIDLDGSVASTTTTTGLSTGNFNHTITSWVYLQSSDNEGNVFSVGTFSGGNYHASMMQHWGGYFAHDLTSDMVYYEAGLNNDEWYHLAIVYYTNKTAKFYVNGEWTYQATHTNAMDLQFGSGQVVVGGRVNGDQPWDSFQDDIRYYEVALNGSQIEEIYNEGSGTEDNPITSESPPEANDSCSCSGDADCYIKASDNCVINDTIDNGGYNLFINESGIITFLNNLTNIGNFTIRGTDSENKAIVYFRNGGIR